MPKDAPPPDKDRDLQAAGGGPCGVATPNYHSAAARLLDNGYAPLPIVPATKRPAPSRWSTVNIDDAQVGAWSVSCPGYGIGLRTGHLVGVDIDILDPYVAHQVQCLAHQRLGETLMRVGQWPKRLLLYRTIAPFAKLKTAGLEILGQGQQFVAFGIHPTTGQPYDWPMGDTPLDVALADLPIVDQRMAEAFLVEAAALIPLPERTHQSAGRRQLGQAIDQVPLRDRDGKVTDHRDAWLSTIAFHAVHDAIDTGQQTDAAPIAERVWQRFTATTDLTRPSSGRGRPFLLGDAARKVADKLRLLADGRLPARVLAVADPVPLPYGLPVGEARQRLDGVLSDTCRRIGDWHEGGYDGPAPRIGIRASVGLGKTAVTRGHVLALRDRLRTSGLPDRIVVFTPSHILAEETAVAWRSSGVEVAVHRGYEARHPERQAPMCQDLDMVRMAITARQSVFASSCMRKGGSRCHAFDSCLKQENRGEIRRADVVIAPYDTLFTGLAVDMDRVGVLIIDEGCWPRGLRETRGLYVETLASIDVPLEARGDDPAEEEWAWARLFAFRQRVTTALTGSASGPVMRSRLLNAGLMADECTEAAMLEVQLRPDPGLQPGLAQGARRRAAELTGEVLWSIRRETLFLALARLIAGEEEQNGRVRVLSADPRTGVHEIMMTDVHALHESFANKPVVHLDATLRPVLAQTALPGLEVTEIAADMPHMSLTLVQGSFGKTTLCQDPAASAAENQRRANRLGECVDHVRWEARRVAPGRVLVVTYKSCEEAFQGIPGVEVAHFNAIAGLDVYGDVALLIVIGRPLPQEAALHPLCGAYFAIEPEGAFAPVLRGVPMRDGSMRGVRVMQHQDPRAETLRAAICDDEVIQAIGRGRGVNRTADNPLEVHVLADVALPLVHDRIVAWDSVKPDIVQRMLLAGVAIDSPSDAAILHPGLFGGPEAAESAFRRDAFNRHNPIYNTYREMTVKSAEYRRGGRGHSWQTALWIDGDAEDVRELLERNLGTLGDWKGGRLKG